MSTLGGNRGERDKNAKPKFQQLDINSLYRSSRVSISSAGFSAMSMTHATLFFFLYLQGETSEPTTQKNAVPRKHGMQSLGKVPSARRPPANLPSLKAETSSPASATTQSSDQQQQQTTNSSSASWADSSAPAGAQALNNITLSANQTSQLNTSGGSLSASQTHTGGNSAASSSSTSWSAVATGGNVKEENLSQPPLYQSPQFQNEFPSLDGSVTTNAGASVAGLKLNANSNSHDSGEMNLRPSTDAASWMQQQQSNSGNARGGGGENGSSGNYPPPDIVPAKFMALMPSFMMRGTQSAGMTSSPASYTQNQSNQSRDGRDNRDNRDTGRDGGGYQNQARQGRNSSQYGGGSYNNDYSNNRDRDNGPPRHRQPPPRHQGRHNDDRGSSYEPEIIVQRPIIKDSSVSIRWHATKDGRSTTRLTTTRKSNSPTTNRMM
jgi:BAT2 N-terminus